jgi:hypothetical protein
MHSRQWPKGLLLLLLLEITKIQCFHLQKVEQWRILMFFGEGKDWCVKEE